MNSAFSVIKAEYQTNQTVVAAAIWLSFSGFFFFFLSPAGAMLTFLSFHATPGKTEKEKNKISMKYLLFMSSFYSDFPLCDSSYLALIWFHAAERLQCGSVDGFCLEERQRDDFELFAQKVWEHKTLPLSLWLTRSCTQRGVSHVGPYRLTQMNDILQLNLKHFLFALQHLPTSVLPQHMTVFCIEQKIYFNQ